MKFIKLCLLIIVMCFLTGCLDKQYKPLSENQNLILTINIKDMSVTFVDADRRKEVSRWEMKKPYSGGMILDNDHLLLYGTQVETVDLYSLSTGRLIDNWKTGKGIVNAKLLIDVNEVVFADQIKNQARFFTLDGKESGAVSTKQHPFTILEGEDKLFIINTNDEEVTIIDQKKKNKIASLEIHPSATGALLIENQNELWIGGHGVGIEGESDIHVYNLENGSLITEISAPMMPVNFAQWNQEIFALSHGSNTLYKFSETGEEIDSMRIGANPFALSVFHDEIIVAGYDSNDIYFIDPKNMKIIQKVNVGQGPFQLIVRESR